MIHGTYYLSGTSTAKSAFAIEEGKERIVVICSHSHRLLVDATPSDFTTGLNLPGQAVDVEFTDGSVFTPHNATFRWQHLTKGQSMASRLETSLPFILACLILIPSLFYTIHSIVLPETASYLVHVISDETKHQIGKRSYKSISNLSMSPTGLTSLEEARVRELWEETLKPSLYLLKTTHFGYTMPRMSGPTHSPSQTERSLSRMNWFASMRGIQTDSRR